VRGQSLILFLVLAALGSAADFHGKVIDDLGLPVSGAVVTLTGSSINGPVPVAISNMTTSALDGTYTVPGLPPGPYVVCATPQAKGLLDSCRWEAQTVFQLASTTSAPIATTQLKRGAVISIRVDDPLNALTAVLSGGQVSNLSIGVRTATGRFHAAYRASSDVLGYDYLLTVPSGISLNFQVITQHLLVKDLLGSVVSNIVPTVLNLTANQTQQFHYTLLGAP
jgi:Carboxypeptidase regulatory-like domain